MRIAIVDDENDWINIVEDMIFDFKAMYRNIDWDIFYSAEELLKDYTNHNADYNVLITDIELKNISGIELANTLRKLDPELSIFFLTSHDEYMRDCFKSQPVNFWSKPIDKRTFMNDMERVYNELTKEDSVFPIKEGATYYRVKYKDIFLFSNKGRKIVAHTKKRSYEFYGSFKEYLKIWEENGFIAVSRFDCVNTKHMSTLNGNSLTLDDQTEVNVSTSHVQKIKEKFFKIDCDNATEGINLMR